MVFQQNLLEKAYFIAKMSCPAMVRPASSDFWKTPFVCFQTTWLRFSDKLTTLTAPLANDFASLRSSTYGIYLGG